jgi:hypothetical protein
MQREEAEFLEPAVSYQVAQQMAGTERLPLSEQTLRSTTIFRDSARGRAATF